MYLAMNLDEKSTNLADNFLQEFIVDRPKMGEKVKDWAQPKSKHVTICMGGNTDRKYNYREGEMEVVEVTGIMIGEGNIALRVEVPRPTKNPKNPHITMLYNKAGGFKPKDSNYIGLTIKVQPFILVGVVTLNS